MFSSSNNGHGVSMTQNSGIPYTHGTPRLPIHPRPNPTVTAHTYATNAIESYANGHTLPTVHFPTATQPGPQTPTVNGGQNGFMPVGLHAAPAHTNGSPHSPNSGQPLPVQPIRIQTIQPNNHAPSHPMVNTLPPNSASNNPGINFNHLPQVLPTRGGGGVSFTPEGRGAQYNRMHGSHHGSRESLDSNLSTISSNLSIGSTMSSGSGKSS